MVGIVNFLRQDGQLRHNKKLYERNFITTYKVLYTGRNSCCRDKVNRAAGRPAYMAGRCAAVKACPSTGTGKTTQD